MSLLENLFSQGMIERLGWTLVHFLWQATGVAVLLAVLLRLLRRAGASLRYAIACGALALMVALPLITMQLVEVPGPVAEAGPPSDISPAAIAAPIPVTVQVVDELPPSASAQPVEIADLAESIPWQGRVVAALEPALPYLVLGWLAGVFGLSTWHLGGWAQLQRLKRRMAREAGAALHTTLDELATRLGVRRAVMLLESALVEVPTVVGWLRPVILLPASALTGLSPDQLRAILAHELAHIRRYDYLANILQTVVEILGFYHPAVWWVSHRIRVERENCCDDLAVRICGNSLQYARALTSMEEIRHGRADLAMAVTGGSLIARIARLLGRPAVDDRRFAWLPGLIALLLVAGTIIPAALVLAAPAPATGLSIQGAAVPALPETSGPPIEEPARTQVVLTFSILDVFADHVLDTETAAEARNLLTRVPAGDARRPPTSATPPILEELLMPLRDIFAGFTPVPEKSKYLMDLLVSRGYAKVLSRPKILTFADEPASIMTGEENDPNAPSSPSAGEYMRLTALAHVLEDQDATRLEIDHRDRRAIGDPQEPNRPMSSTEIASILVVPNGRYVAVISNSIDDSEPRLRVLLVGPTTIHRPQRDAEQDRSADVQTMIENEVSHTAQEENEAQVLIDFVVAKALTTTAADRETLLLIGAALAGEDPRIVGEIAASDPRRQVTLGEFMKKHVTGRILAPATMEALVDVLQTRGYIEIQAKPSILTKDNVQAQIKVTSEERFQPAEDPALPPQRIELGTTVQATPHLAPDAGDRIRLEIGVQLTDLAPQTRPDDHLTARRTEVASTVTILNDRYFLLLVERDGGEGVPSKDPESMLVMFRPRIVRPVPPPDEQPAAQAQQASSRPRQVLLEARVVAMERSDLLNPNVEWSFPTVRAGQALDDRHRLEGIRMGYSPDRTFTDSLIAALDRLAADKQADIVAHPQLIALDGYRAQLRSVQEEWFMMSMPQAPSVPTRSELQKTESGTVVTMTPHVGDNNDITLKMAVEVFESIPRAQGSDLPIVTRRQAKNSVTIRDGGTVAIAGLTERLLSQNSQLRKELAIFVTAHLVSETGPIPRPSSPRKGTVSPTSPAANAESMSPSGESQAPASAILARETRDARREYVNSDPMVRKFSENIAQMERDLIVSRQTLSGANPAVAQREAMVKAFQDRLLERRAELKQKFDAALTGHLNGGVGEQGGSRRETAVSAEQMIAARQAFVNSDPTVRELTASIVETESDLLVLQQSHVPAHPSVVQKKSLLEAFRRSLEERRVTREREFDGDHPYSGGSQIALVATLAKVLMNRTLDRETATQAFNLIAPADTGQPPMSRDKLRTSTVGQILGRLAGRVPAESFKAVVQLLRSKGLVECIAQPHFVMPAGQPVEISGIGCMILQTFAEVLPADQAIQLDVEVSVEITRPIPPPSGRARGQSPPMRSTRTIKSSGSLKVLNERHGLLVLGGMTSGTDQTGEEAYCLILHPTIVTPDMRQATLGVDESIDEGQAHGDANQPSQAWTIMQQFNSPRLLQGLGPRLAKLLEPEHQDDPVWEPVIDEGQLVVKIDMDEPAHAEVTIGLFEDAKWSKAPVAVRRVAGAGTHVLTGLPTGRFQIGAIAGKYAHALGVQRQWPKPIEIRMDRTASVELLVSQACREAAGLQQQGIIWNYLGHWDGQDDRALLRGRVTGPDGEPIPFASVAVREYNPGANGIAAPNLGTDVDGIYKFGEMKWPYTVSVCWHDPLPAAFGSRRQVRHLNRVFEGPQELNVRFDRFPQGTARVTGQVVDEHGEPVRAFLLHIQMPGDATTSRSDGQAHTEYGYSLPFISEDGRFEARGLPEGPATVRAVAIGALPYEANRGEDIVLEAGTDADVQLELTHVKFFYGRALFEDGTPAVLQPAPWEGAKTIIGMHWTPTPGGWAGHNAGEVDDAGYFGFYLRNMELEGLRSGHRRLDIRLPRPETGSYRTVGQFPLDRLSEDRNQAGSVMIPRPEPPK